MNEEANIEESAPDIQPITDLIEWRPESSRNAGMTTKTPFVSLHNPNSPTINDPIIHDSEDESIMMENNAGLRTRVVSFVVGQLSIIEAILVTRLKNSPL